MAQDNEMIKSGLQFSVVIPVYNGASTIQRAIDSVLAQSYAATQIIVVDDASSDDTAELLQKNYGDQIIYIKKILNSGSSVARNTGMDAATGDYIAFLDADDIWHPDKLLLLTTILSNQPGIRLFYHQFTRDNITGQPLPENITLFQLPFVKLLPANLVATSCMVVKNDPAIRFDPDMRYTEDYDLALRMAYKYKIYFINIALTQIFRKFTSKGGISENKWKMRKGEMRAYTKLIHLNLLFVFLLPFLLLSSMGKHLYKAVAG